MKTKFHEVGLRVEYRRNTNDEWHLGTVERLEDNLNGGGVCVKLDDLHPRGFNTVIIDIDSLMHEQSIRLANIEGETRDKPASATIATFDYGYVVIDSLAEMFIRITRYDSKVEVKDIVSGDGISIPVHMVDHVRAILEDMQ